MILVKPSVSVMRVTQNALELIEEAGRTCYKSEEKIAPGTAEVFVKGLLTRGHESVLEHASATVRFICDRGVSHEIVRHRLASYSQESTRYCDYNGGHVTFVIPPWVNLSAGLFPVEWDGLYGGCPALAALGGAASVGDNRWFWSMAVAEREYGKLRRLELKPEQARSVLPNGLKTEIVMTANFREWRHFFKLRTAPAAHPQMREVAVSALALLQAAVPVVFNDI